MMWTNANSYSSDRERDSKDDRDDRDRRENGANGDDRKGTLNTPGRSINDTNNIKALDSPPPAHDDLDIAE